MRASRAWLLNVLLATNSLFAQEPSVTPPTSTLTRAVLAGIVIKEPGSEPMKKAVVELIAENQSEAENYTSLSNIDGSFRIENIIPGRYRLFVERTGYQEVSNRHLRADGRVVALAPGQDLKDIVIHLQAAAVVEGRVTDEDGDPMPEAQVAILHQKFLAGRSRWEQVAAERTNDLGEYRIPGLPAGNYFVSVTPPPDFRSLIEAAGNSPSLSTWNAPSASEKPAATAYQTTYYPGTRDRGQATPIHLRAGDDFPANFSLTPGPSVTIRGSVANLPPGASASVTLQSKDFNLMLNGAEMHKDGSFEIRDVAPGAYTIVATVDNASGHWVARQAVQLATTNVDGLRLTPQLGGEIHGHLRIDAAGDSGNAKLDLSQIFLLLRSAADEDALDALAVGEGFSPLAQVSADGRV